MPSSEAQPGVPHSAPSCHLSPPKLPGIKPFSASNPVYKRYVAAFQKRRALAGARVGTGTALETCRQKAAPSSGRLSSLHWLSRQLAAKTGLGFLPPTSVQREEVPRSLLGGGLFCAK